jgi:predicted RNA-binding protein YlqC (UPF0109 family)
LVEHPEEVSIVEEPGERGTTFFIHVHPDDVGRVIGKGGSVIHAIRNIGKIRALKEGIHAQITIAD